MSVFAEDMKVRLPIRFKDTVLTVDCVLGTTRSVFGRTEWQVTPVAGEGTLWVTEATLTGETEAHPKGAIRK